MKKGCDIMISVNYVTHKISSRDPNHIADVVMGPNFGSISMKNSS